MARLRYNGIGGKIDDDPLTSTATAVNSTSLSALPVIASPDYVSVTFDPDGVYGAPEIIWITAHGTTATSATILRAQENTVARSHPNDTFWIHGISAADFTNLDLFSNYTPDNSGLWTPDLGFDYEFNGSSTALPTGWSWVNQGSSTYVEDYGSGVIRGVAASGINWRCLVRSLSGAPSAWLATGKLQYVSKSSNESTAGLVLRESSSGKLFTLYWYSTATSNDVYVVYWPSPTSGSPTVVGGPYTMQPYDYPKYWRIRKNSATSWDMEVSHNGTGWYQVLGATNVATYFTPDQIGFGGYNSASTAFDLSCDWLRLR